MDHMQGTRCPCQLQICYFGSKLVFAMISVVIIFHLIKLRSQLIRTDCMLHILWLWYGIYHTGGRIWYLQLPSLFKRIIREQTLDWKENITTISYMHQLMNMVYSVRQPMWGNLKDLPKAIKLCEPGLSYLLDGGDMLGK